MRLKYGLIIILFSVNKLYSQESIINQGKLLSQNITHKIKYADTEKEIDDNVLLKNDVYKFIFDTGAPLSISKEIQAKNNYKIIHKVPIFDATDRKDTVIIVELDTFTLGQIKIVKIPALVIDFKNSPIGCQGIEGIIGSNVARFFVVKFDIKHKSVSLTNDRDMINQIGMVYPKPVFLDYQSNAFFEVDFGDNFKDTVHFDSGKNSFYDMNYGTAKKLIKRQNHSYSYGKGSAGQGIFGTGIVEDLLRINSSITISNTPISQVIIESTQAKSRLGREVLNYGVLTIDYINSMYSFVKYPLVTFTPKAFFGFELISENNKLMASVVWENTPVARKGLYSGAEILSINGRRFSSLNQCEIHEVIHNELRKKYLWIEFSNNGKLQFIKVKRHREDRADPKKYNSLFFRT